MSLPREEELGLFGKLSWKEALALIGPRRAGKSTLALRLLDAWQSKGGQGQYFDLEKTGAPSSVPALADAVKAVPKGGLLVLDEIQTLSGWERLVREEIEYGRHHVLVTGSSASLLSKEISTILAGRAVPQHVLPLSFRNARAWGLNSFEQYLRVGGYPECVLRTNDAPTLHRLYFELAVLRDVAARKGIREVNSLKDLAILLLSESGKVISSKKTADALGISQPTLRSYVDGLVDAFLVLRVPPLVRSPRERLVADTKHYAWDTGLQKSVSVSESPDFGRRLENVVAVELARRGYDLAYLGGTAECDFVATAPGKARLAVQVFSGDSLPSRELEGLQSGMKMAERGLLLTARPVDAVLPRGAECKTVEEWLLAGPRTP
ncbi:ATP-binding protein [Candidatus Micrarchaeota archaeon]|nr:ATP-binding protein [Candidatus Micrarchaeota archaeon]